jgi:hypothetical protein
MVLPLKESTHSRTDGAKSPLTKLPAPSSAPEKVRTINVCLKRDTLALVQVTAATAIPSHVNVTEQTKEVLVESAEALYEDFRTADPIDSILARLMCGISSMTMDSLSRGTWTQNLVQREMELKTATRGALVIAELTKAYDGRRTRGKQTVNVGQVNVEAGGQAVVGNVTSATRPTEVPQAASAPEKQMSVRPEEAAQGMSLPRAKIEDPTPPQK